MSQNVGISDVADFTPENSALLELRSIIRGFLMPQMTAIQKNAILNPAHGLMVVQTDNQPGQPNGIWYYDAIESQWKNIFSTSPTSLLFSDIQTGTNISAVMTVGSGAVINLDGTGIIESNKFIGNGSLTDVIDLNTEEVTGTLTVDKGGTGINILPPAGSFIYSNGTSYITTTQPTNDGQVLAYDLNTSTWIPQDINIQVLPEIEDGKIWIGDVNNEPVALAISGDGTISNTGLLTVTGIQGTAVDSTQPTDGQILAFNSASGLWVPGSPTLSGSSKWILDNTKLHPNPLNDWYSMQWGSGTSSASQSTAFGGGSASGYRATAWGTGTTATQNLATAWGENTSASGNLATAWGSTNTASGNLATAWGSTNTASGNLTTVWGQNNTVAGNIATAWGSGNIASQPYATAFGQNTTASAGFTTAWGDNTDATSQYATAFGQNSLASGQYATAFGLNSVASGTYSTAFGQNDTAFGTHSLAFGHNTKALGIYSTSSGFNTTAFSGMETVIGQYNTSYTPQNAWGWNLPDRVFVIGNGTENNSRSDALIVKKSGDTELYGNFSLISSTGNSKELRLYEPPANGVNYTAIKAKAQDSNLIYTMPANFSKGIVNTGSYVLVSDINGNVGNLSWSSAINFLGGTTVPVYLTPQNGDYTAGVEDLLIVITTANKTVNLPKASTVPGKVYYIALASNISPANVTAFSGDLISTSVLTSTITLRSGNGNGFYSAVLMVSDGTGIWYVITSRRTD